MHSSSNGNFEQSSFSNSGFAFFGNFSKQPVVTELKDNIYYKSGKKKYDKFYENFYFETGQKVIDKFNNTVYYENRQKAFDGFHGDIFYRNGKKAYDCFWLKAKYENGNELGKTGMRYSAEGVSMNLCNDVDQFFINLGQDFHFFVGILENHRSKDIRLYSGTLCVYAKTL